MHLVINELGPNERFARDNILLVSVWQGKRKPAFKQFIKAFSDKLKGVKIQCVSVNSAVRMKKLCSTVEKLAF